MQPGDKIAVRVSHFDPSVDRKPHLERYEVEYEPEMRVLDVLSALQERQGVSLTFRWFCSTRKCGACGVRVNGVPKLACWEPAEPDMVIEPLDKFPVIRDLLVDREPYQKRYLELKPHFVRAEAPPFPEPVTHRQMARVFELMDCLECGICTSVCPSYTGADGVFPGPHALVMAARFATDPRDELDRASLLGKAGIENCMSCYACEEACPLMIRIVGQAIEPLKNLCAGTETSTSRVARLFADNLRRGGYVDSPSLYAAARGLGGATRSLPLALSMLRRGKIKVGRPASARARRDLEILFDECEVHSE